VPGTANLMGWIIRRKDGSPLISHGRTSPSHVGKVIVRLDVQYPIVNTHSRAFCLSETSIVQPCEIWQIKHFALSPGAIATVVAIVMRSRTGGAPVGSDPASRSETALYMDKGYLDVGGQQVIYRTNVQIPSCELWSDERYRRPRPNAKFIDLTDGDDIGKTLAN
jgi:hypothetical protein